MKYLGDLWHGISSRPWKLAQYTFAGFSVVLTILRGITYFIPAIKCEGVRSLTIAVGIGSIYGLRKAWKPSRIEIPLANCNTVIEIIWVWLLFGNENSRPKSPDFSRLFSLPKSSHTQMISMTVLQREK